jgi:chorismate dehydratase
VRRITVGIVDFLNSKPLAWAFLPGDQGLPGDQDRSGEDGLRQRYRELFDASFHPPAKVAELLAAGRLDIGLIPAIEVQRIPDLSVLPGLCVAATEEVRSVLLVHRGPIAQIRRVALDANSRTSAALVKILLADRYGLSPEYRPAQPRVEEMLADADAALVIGDPALAVDRQRYRILDLAAEWRALTGKPAVFAVWAVRRGVELPDLAGYFAASLRAGQAAMDRMVAESAAQLGLHEDDVRRYLTRNLSFELDEEALAGLTEYYRRAHAHGLIETLRPLCLYPPPAAVARAPQSAAVF